MKKYNVYLYYYEDDESYVAVCPEFFNFIIYHNNEDKLKDSVLHSLIVYTNNPDLSDNNINYIKTNKKIIEQNNQAEPITML